MPVKQNRVPKAYIITSNRGRRYLALLVVLSIRMQSCLVTKWRRFMHNSVELI